MARPVETLFPLNLLKDRWTASRFLLDQMVKSGALPTVMIGKRRFVHVDTIERIESAGKRCRKSKQVSEEVRR